MKKILGIVVLGLLLSGNAYAEIIYLSCTFKNGSYFNKKSKIVEIKTNSKISIKVDTRSKKIYSPWPSIITEIIDIKWSDDTVSWTQGERNGTGELGHSYKLDRISGTLNVNQHDVLNTGITRMNYRYECLKTNKLF